MEIQIVRLKIEKSTNREIQLVKYKSGNTDWKIQLVKKRIHDIKFGKHISGKDKSENTNQPNATRKKQLGKYKS